MSPRSQQIDLHHPQRDLPRLAEAPQLYDAFSMNVSRDYENLDWTWQWPRLDAGGKVE